MSTCGQYPSCCRAALSWLMTECPATSASPSSGLNSPAGPTKTLLSPPPVICMGSARQDPAPPHNRGLTACVRIPMSGTLLWDTTRHRVWLGRHERLAVLHLRAGRLQRFR